MYKLIAILIVVLMLGCTSNGKNEAEMDYIFENVNVIPMNKPDVMENMAVVLNKGKIVKVIKQENAYTINTKQRINGEGRYLMPGLADMHVHVRWDPQKMFNLFVSNGVTTVANMYLADGDFDHIALRNQINSGAILGPRYLISGMHLEGDFPATLEEVDRVLDEHLEKKINFVKVHGDLDVNIYNAVVAGAKKRGLKVIGHAQHKMPLKNSLVLDSLEHMEEFLYVAQEEKMVHNLKSNFLPAYRANVDRLFDESYRKKIVKDVAASGITIDPTLIVYKMVGVWQSDEDLAKLGGSPDVQYLPNSVRDFWLSPKTNPYQEEGFPLTKAEVDKNLRVLFLLTKELYDQGVPMLSGTDSFGTLVPGISLHDELKLLVDAGLSPFEALECSTVNVAEYLGEQGYAGVIQEGARADFILLDQNPLIDIRNSRSVSGVFTHGRWLSRSELSALLLSSLQE
jgi:imidazolonepropionase-like amidohydrolase